MEHPAEIIFRGMGRSQAMEDRVQARIDKLVRWFPDLLSCRVAIEADHHHHHKGNLYRVRIDVAVPGSELAVGREPPQHQAHADAYVAIRDAFDAITRRLEDRVRRQRGDVKHHQTPSHGVVSALFPDGGVIMTPDERTIAFHAHSVVDHGFERLEVGHEVRFVEVDGDDGPRASTVHVVGKHHVTG